MTHGYIAAIFCGICWLVSFPIGGLFIVGFYVGRELAQAEYRYIEDFCGRRRSRMPWYAPFTPAAWTKKGMLDWIIPLGVFLFPYFVERVIWLFNCHN